MGVGTLYRNFPQRIDLVEAVYETTSRSCPRRPSRRSPPSSRGPRWWPSSRRSCATRGPSRRCWASCSRRSRRTRRCARAARELINSAFDLVIERAKEAGVIRDDVDGSDVTHLVSPVCTNASMPPEQTRRLIGIILDGLKLT